MGYEDDFEGWARLSAALRGRDERARQRILQASGVADYGALELRWAQALLEDLAHGDLERAMAYSDACAEEAERRSRGEDRWAELLAAPAAPTPNTSPPAEPTPAATPAVTDFGSTMYQAGPPSESAAEAASPLWQSLKNHQRDRPASSAPATDDFVGSMQGEAEVVAPKPGQDSTASVARDDSLATARCIAIALNWPVEKYAQLCMALRSMDQESVCARYALPAEALPMVTKGWNDKLAKDPGLYGRWRQWVDYYQQQSG